MMKLTLITQPLKSFRTVFLFLSLFYLLTGLNSSYAQTTVDSGTQQNPKQLVINITQKFASLSAEQRHALLQSSTAQQDFIRTHLLPYFAQRQMAQYVMGAHWRNASEQQRQDFQTALMDNLVNNYSANLFRVPIEFIKIKKVFHPKNRRAEIETQIGLQNGASQPLKYRALQSQHDDQWYLYDFSFNNISALVTLQTLYKPLIQFKGLDSVITQLRSGATF